MMSTSRRPVTIGIDLSTTAAKALAVRADGAVVATSRVPYETTYRRGGWVEQDANDWMESVVAVLTTISERLASRYSVEGIGLTTQGISVVPVDRTGSPLRPSINWLDTRATAESEALERAHGPEAIYRTTGRRAHPALTLPKIAWMRRHEPDVARRVARWELPHSYLSLHLAGTSAVDRSLAAGTLGYDLHGLDWSVDLCQWAGISLDALPNIMDSGSSVGGLTGVAAARTGLPAGTPVFVGGQDQKVAAFAAGLSESTGTVSLGTAAAISARVDRPVLDPRMGIPLSPFVLPGQWVLEGVVAAAGASVEWLARALSVDRRRPITSRKIFALAESSPAGASGVRFTPGLSDSNLEPGDTATGGTFTGISLSTTAADLSRAVLEGVGDAIAARVHEIGDLGVPIRALRVFGGGARSELWCSIIEQQTGVPVELFEQAEAAALGASMLAARGSGVIDAGVSAVGAFDLESPSAERV